MDEQLELEIAQEVAERNKITVFNARLTLLIVIEIIVGIGVIWKLIDFAFVILYFVLVLVYCFWTFRKETWELLKLWFKRVRGDMN